VQGEIKEAIFIGASCLIRTIFEEYEAFESDAEFSVDLISDAGLAQRAIFAGETFLMIFDPAYSVPKKAMHEAFVVEYLAHTANHIAQEIEYEEFTIRTAMSRILDAVGIDLGDGDADSPMEEDLDYWQYGIGFLAGDLVGDHDFEYATMLTRLDKLGASFVGGLFADLNLKDPNYFDAYESSYIEKNMNEIVSRCAKIIEFIEKYQKRGNFRPHP
jgi:hypothetical protein